MKSRWQLNRVGILNFWYYAEQEFQLEGGRILFRGANGSGKSVTMQSFLPLVLDGDTRPSRLDPFGSRDRRIDYYLLGEDGEHTDRTGYLWMEFYHSQHERYLSIGIGLRARRGRSHLDFWGFALTDNRRIGHDFQLYQRNYSLSEESMIPLDYKALHELVGAGGQVVQEREAYRRMVNKLLFKYEDPKHYQEMLKLLIELRSPKLSKDFKPTTIYEILNNGLPPLQDDDLRPLTEVLDTIDQINDRKDELEKHAEYVDQLADAYGKYNLFQLYHRSEQVVQADAKRVEQTEEIRLAEAELASIETQLHQTTAEIDQARQEKRQTDAELEILRRDEAFIQEAELRNIEVRKNNILDEIGKTEGRLEYWKGNLKEAVGRLEKQQEKRTGADKKQRELLEELESLARETEFTYHDVFHGRFQREIPEDELMFGSWKSGIEEHSKTLRNALECAREHQEAVRNMRNRESELGIATERRDSAEAAVSLFEEKLETKKEEQQAAVFDWRKQARALRLEEGELTQVLHLLANFPERSYEEVKAAAIGPADRQLQNIWQSQAQTITSLKQLKDEEEAKEAELQTWINLREPEPPRSDAREQTRKTYEARGVSGVPLYASCEFLPHVSAELRATLEAVLQETRLLDAWIGAEGLQWNREDEEFWICPVPLDQGTTLADYLVPTPPEDGSVSSEQIDRFLRSIAVGLPPAAGEHAWISEDGQFRLGTLAGKVQPKDRVEYIGKESRRLTRLAAMAKLEEDLARLRELLAEQEQMLKSLQEQENALKADVAAFPSGQPLLAANSGVEAAKTKLKIAEDELTHKNQLFKAAVGEERLVQDRLRDYTGKWVSLKNVSSLKWAVEQIDSYRSCFFELRTAWSHYFEAQQAIERVEEEKATADEHLEEEQGHLEQYRESLKEAEALIAAYQNALQAMGVADKYAKLKRLQDTSDTLKLSVQNLSGSLENLRVQKGVKEAKLLTERTVLQEAVSILHERIGEWRDEWKLKLTAKWRNEIIGDPWQECVEICYEIVEVHRSGFENRKAESFINGLYATFNEVRMHLHEYVLEMSAGPTERQLIRFNYDRMNPITPEQLLIDLQKEIEEHRNLLSEKEKELLEKVLIKSVGFSIREKIQRADEWVKEMNLLMKQRNTSSGLRLQLKWEPKLKQSEAEIDTSLLVKLLSIDYELLNDEDRDQIYTHFKEKINSAKKAAEDQRSLREAIQESLDYRDWFRFKLSFKKGEQPDYRELTDSRFNVLSGGEKAMAMYIPLFAAVSSRYKGSSSESPQLISLDEAFAGVDDENVRDMFELLSQMGFDYMMTSQVLWGCYDTVPGLAIYEIVRPKDAKNVTVIPYIWNGKERVANLAALGQDLAG